MPKSRVISRVEPRPPRFRNTITTVMLVLVTVMIVRDILVRRRASPSRSPDVTQRSP